MRYAYTFDDLQSHVTQTNPCLWWNIKATRNSHQKILFLKILFWSKHFLSVRNKDIAQTSSVWHVPCYKLRRLWIHVSEKITNLKYLFAENEKSSIISHKLRGALRLYGALGWNLERGPFYVCKTVVDRAKTLNERTEAFVLLKHKKLEQETNHQLIWMSQYEQNSLIPSLHFLLETWYHIDKCLQDSGGMLWSHCGTLSTRTQLSRPLWRDIPYINALPFVSITRPLRYPDCDNSTVVTCHQQFPQPHHVVLKHLGYKDLYVCACAISANVT